MWLAATYRDEYARSADDGQLIARTEIDVAFFISYDEGWARERFSPGPEP